MSNENETKKIEDITEADVQKVKDQIDEKVIKEHSLNEKQEEIYKRILEEAELPTTLTDEIFKLGKNELDVRHLSKKNYQQMMFRAAALQNVYLKQILTSLVDLTRLSMIIADKLGVEDIIKATDDIIEKQREQLEKREGVKLPESKKEVN